MSDNEFWARVWKILGTVVCVVALCVSISYTVITCYAFVNGYEHGTLQGQQGSQWVKVK